MDTTHPSAHANEIRYTLEVLDEYSHLGLDEQHASKLRNILERQLHDADEPVSCGPVQPIRFPGFAE